MDELNAQEQAKYIGWQGAFYNVAKIIGTGLLVYLAGFLKDEYEGPAEDAVLYSWTVIMIVLGGVMFALGLRASMPIRSPLFRRVWPSYGMSSGTSLLKSISFITSALLFYIVLPKGL